MLHRTVMDAITSQTSWVTFMQGEPSRHCGLLKTHHEVWSLFIDVKTHQVNTANSETSLHNGTQNQSLRTITEGIKSTWIPILWIMG